MNHPKDHNMNGHRSMVEGESNTVEYLKFIGVIISILTVSYFLYLQSDVQNLQNFMRWFMGVFMATFAGFKFIGYKMFVVMFAGYDIVAKHFNLYAKLFPFIELSLASLYIFNLLPVGRNILMAIVTGLASIGVFKEIYKRKTGIHCACLGNVIKLPLSTVSLVEDLGMFVMAIIMILM